MYKDWITPVIAVVTISTITLFLALEAIDCNRRTRERNAPKKISCVQVREGYIDQKIDKLKNSQLFGDSEVGIRGGSELYKTIRQQALELFPDGSTLIQCGRLCTEFPSDEYERVCMIYFNSTGNKIIYRLINNQNKEGK